MADDLEGYDALKGGAGALELHRDVIAASGPDALAYLQGQFSQDVAALAPGDSAWSLVLAPAGRVDALVRVTRLDPQLVDGGGDGAAMYLLDTDGGWGEALLARLNRFKLRTKANFESLPWRTVALRGPQVHPPAPSKSAPVVADASWPGLPGVDIIGPAPQMPDGVEEAGSGAYEAARIEAGVPAMGAELTERTIPAEAGIVARTVSFTKGCYTGQELVARIDSRGSHVARRLRGILLPAGVQAGTPVEADGKEVGWVTSVAFSPALGWVALGYVGRAVTPPAAVRVAETDARVVALPMEGPQSSPEP